MSKPVALVAAGGTGGHLFPAHALTSELVRRGWDVHLVSDDRALSYGIPYPGAAVHTVASATMRGRNPIALMQTAWGIGRGWLQSSALLRRLKPQIVIGFGGYPTLPPLLAARFAGVPFILHESNGVMGRANKMMMSRAAAVATSLDRTYGLEDFAGTVVKTGNPVRDNVLAQAGRAYPNRKPGERFQLLVFGGSQGARVFSEVVPAAMAELPVELRQQLRLIQQCRPEDLSDVAGRYEQLGLDAHLANFIEDMPDQIAQSHLVIARSGASTVSELTVIGRPSLLVPLPHSLDNDQLKNAQALEEAGGAVLIRQDAFTPPQLAQTLANFIANPDALSKMAAAALAAGTAEASTNLADLVEQIGKRGIKS